jgi:hypothetical protein
MMKTSIGYPDLVAGADSGVSDRNPSASLIAVITTTAVVADMATPGASVHADSAILRYVAQRS